MSLAIVGLGPGGPEHRTRAAEDAIRSADVVIGYAPYVDQCADLLTAQEVIRGTMGEELERAREAVERARGARVALVSSGDAGVHGMAARTLALADGIEVTVLPGVTAALAAAARLGAPLADDWATLSLSDLHTPWETIERRLTALAASGIALALYNPRSKTRHEPFDRALNILREHRDADTPVVVATDVTRDGEIIEHATLATLDAATVTMRSLVLVAGDTAQWAGEWLVADRTATRAAPARPRGARRRPSRGPRVTVHLVGAGPGDPQLLTLAAAELLRAARVVVYDRPSMDAILALAPPDAERHCVGRARGRRALEQHEVNALLVDLARHGDVVRLKSGDPFVASRGGEEAVALQDAGIEVKVVPGVSAALAAPAAAGIPLMLRQLSVTATFVDGNDDPEHADPPDWDALAKLGGTLVILTGRGHIRRIAAKLLQGGRAPDTPIAAISAADRPEQQVLRGTLIDLPAPLPPPVTFVVGEAAALNLVACTSPTAS